MLYCVSYVYIELKKLKKCHDTSGNRVVGVQDRIYAAASRFDVHRQAIMHRLDNETAAAGMKKFLPVLLLQPPYYRSFHNRFYVCISL